ncbi:MAG: 7TM diverse intracellular signaling domain-containing protein [Pseudomonadales bacterium]
MALIDARALVVAVGLLLAVAGNAAPLELDELGTDAPIGPHIDYLVETGQPLALDDLNTAAFHSYEKRVFNIGLERRPIWLRIAVRNAAPDPAQWVLSLNRALLESLRIVVVRGAARETLLDLDNTPAHAVYDEYGTLATRFSLAANESATLYLRYQAPNSSVMNLSVDREREFLERQSLRLTIYLASLAGVATLVLYNLILFFLTGLGPFTYYALAQILAFAYFSHLGGVTSIYLWPDHPDFGRALATPLATSVSIFMCLFARGFLETGQHAPRLDRLLVWLIAGLTVVTAGGAVLLAFGVESRTWLNLASATLTSFTWILLPLVGVRYVLFREVRYLPVAVAWFLFAFVAIYTSLSLVGMVPVLGDFLIGYSLIIYVEALMLAISLALWVRDLRARSLSVEQALSRALRQRLEQSERARGLAEERHLAIQEIAEQGQLLQAAGHDSRQMLGAMRYFASGLTGNASVERVNFAGSSILQLIDHLDDVLSTTVGHYQGGGLNADVLALDRVHPADLFEPIRMIYQRPAAAGGTTLRFAAGRWSFISDRVLLLRIISNLVGNAVQYAAGGRVLVTARLRDGAPCIRVQDDGPGMAPAILAALLSDDGATVRDSNEPGTGNGIRVARRLTAAIGGSLNCASAPAAGTRFELCLPRASMHPRAPEGAVSVAVFDPGSSDRQNLTDALRRVAPGSRVLAADGSEPAIPGADIAFVEYSLARADSGFSFDRLGPRTALALTTHDRGADVRSQAGAFARLLLYKPVDPEVVAYALAWLTERGAEKRLPATASPEARTTN